MESDSASIVKKYIHGYIQISSLTNNIVQAYINYPFLSREREREETEDIFQILHGNSQVKVHDRNGKPINCRKDICSVASIIPKESIMNRYDIYDVMSTKRVQILRTDYMLIEVLSTR